MTPAREPVHIRWMIRRDMPEVLAISAVSGYPWAEEQFCRRLRKRNVIGMVAEGGEWGHEYTPVIAGYMVYHLDRSTLTLLALAVEPTWRRQGVGAALMRRLRQKLQRHGRDRLVARARETDDRAIHWLRSQGLRAVGVERDCYPDCDGYLFSAVAEPAEPSPKKGGGLWQDC